MALVEELPGQFIVPLKGLTREDCVSVEEQFEQELREASLPVVLPLPELPDSIPSRYANPGSWPGSTNLCCWHCTRRFATPPVFVPTCVEDSGFGVRGNMCSFPCAAAYVLDHFPDREAWAAIQRLKELHWVMRKERVEHIPPAPPHTRLSRYGGDLDDARFEALLRDNAGVQRRT